MSPCPQGDGKKAKDLGMSKEVFEFRFGKGGKGGVGGGGLEARCDVEV